MQPRWLISLLDDYCYQGHYYTANADDVVGDTQYTETLGVEHSQRLNNDYLACKHFLETLQSDHKRRHYEHEKHEAQTQSTLNANAKLLEKTEAQVDEIGAELTEWHRQFKLACDWEARAHRRVDAARNALSVAQADLARAESEVARCQAAYDAARSRTISVYAGKDSNGNATYRQEQNPATTELSALNAARSVRSQANSVVMSCQAELNSALADLSRAERQKSGSQRAIDDCESALKVGSDSVRTAEVAMSHGKTASTVLNQKAGVISEIDTLLENMDECLERQLACVTQLRALNDNAQVTFRTVEQARGELVYQMHNLTHAIAERIELLNVFDQPIFVGL